MTPTVPLALIQRHVALGFGLAPRELSSERQGKPIAEARHIAMWLAYEMTGLTMVRIGRAFGGRDHTTVRHALEKAEMRLDREKGLAGKVDRIRTAIEAEAAIGAELAQAVLLTDNVVSALRVALMEMARRDPAKAIAIIVPLARQLAGGDPPCSVP
jgi:hypothetical protein